MTRAARTAEEIDEGMEHHKAGRLAQAEAVYLRILSHQPSHPDALQMMALLKAQSGDFRQAITLINKAISVKPTAAVLRYNLGIFLQNSGEPDAAIESYLNALRIKPDYIEAHVNLGNALKDQGKLKQSAHHYREALSLNPNFVFAHVNLGLVLHQQGEIEAARRSYDRALMLNANSVEANANLANLLLELNEVEQALAHFTRAIEARPDSADAHNGIGNALLRQGNAQEAMASYRRALEIEPRSANASNNMGNALMELGRIEEAIACYIRALEIEPRLAQAHNNMGNALKQQGKMQEAAARYKHALEIKPDYAEAYYHLAMAKAFKPNDPAIRAMKRMLDKPQTSSGEKLYLSFAMGKAHDDLGKYDRAFEFYSTGNRLKRATFNFDIKKEEEFASRLISVFSESLLTQRADFGVKTELPVFILGMPRSGKTLVEQLLATSMSAEAGGELQILPRLVADLPKRFAGLSYPECAAEMTKKQARQIATQRISELKRRWPSAARITNTLPGNFLHIGLIKMILPGAPIIHCVRDPLDTSLFCYFSNFEKGQRFSFDLEEMARYYLLYRRLMNHWHDVLPGSILDIRYEDLVSSPETVMSKALAFCGLDGAQKSSKTKSGEPSTSVESAPKLHAGEIQRWRKYEKHLDPLKRILGGLT